MPREPSVTEIRLDNIIACLHSAIPLLNEINDAFGTPFVPGIVNTILSLITGVQKVKRSKDECVQLMENIHGLLYAIIDLHIKSETGGSLPPMILAHIGKFTETLHKIHMFVEVQQDSNKIRHFFRQNEISNMLKDCRDGVQQTLDTFKMDITIFNSIGDMQKTAETMHRKLLEMISTLSDGTASDRSSSLTVRQLDIPISDWFTAEEELPRIAILGAGGMGKTSLACAALHHPDIATKYEHRFFVACDSASTSVGIAGLLGTHLGLKPAKDLTKPVLENLSNRSSSLLILDNLETPWEPKESRGGVEEFLSLLADIQHLALIITMRGAERPANIRWTRPFLQPLKPLPDEAAWETFVDIAEDSHHREDINHVLRLTDNMPLAVDLIAHLVDVEGCSNVLSRWEEEKTSLLSTGHDRKSNLDASIALSISSSRMNSTPGAKDLLSLLSILPDGLSDVELLQSNLPIREILACRATLLGTSLVYIDANRQLKSLVPIREHVVQFHPPSAHLIEPLLKHFHLVLDLYQRYQGRVEMVSKMDQITSNLGNLHQILRRGLDPDSPILKNVIECTILLNLFNRLTGRGWLPLMDVIPSVFAQPCDHRLEARFITERLISQGLHPIQTPESLINEGISHFHYFNDLVLQERIFVAKFYMAAGFYYYVSRDLSTAKQFLGKALAIARKSGDTYQQAQILRTIAFMKWAIGDYLGCRADARETQRLAQVSANWSQAAEALRTEAGCCTSMGDYKQSITLLSRGRELLKLCGLSGGPLDCDIMVGKAENHLLKSEYGQARRIHTDILRTPTGQQPPSFEFCLVNISQIDVIIGASQHDVLPNLTKAKTIFQATGLLHEVAYCELVLADLQLRERNTVAAKTLFQECFNSSWGKRTEAVSYCLERLADINLWRAPDLVWVSKWTVVYLGHARTTRAKLELHKALQFLGDVFLHNGDEETAHTLFIVALEGFSYMDVHRSRANCMLRLGDLAQRRGQTFEAVELWRSARPLFELASQTKDVAQIDARLGAADHANEKALAQLTTLDAPTELCETLSIVAEEADEGKPTEEDRKQDMCRTPL
ncbi:hypothetical protein FB451DRAFT_1164407 [Mycena latifolia]|nr:hypothetical protein FB451DRAFT_1164407 [Mycena latifolia]